MKKLLGIILIAILFNSCGTLDVYEKTVFFSDNQWKSSQKPAFTFIIEDTVASYNVFVVFRHQDSYHFNNLWLNISTLPPRDTMRTQLIDIPLADNKKGWLGSGMDDVFDHRARITQSPIKLKKGNYTFILQQNMREEPLQFVLNAGIRVEKAQP